LQQTIITDKPEIAFKDTEIAILIGARPRNKGMERKDLIEANGAISLSKAKCSTNTLRAIVKVLVVGNPGQHQCAHCDEERSSARPVQFQRDDAARPQSCYRAGCEKNCFSDLGHQKNDRMG